MDSKNKFGPYSNPDVYKYLRKKYSAVWNTYNWVHYGKMSAPASRESLQNEDLAEDLQQQMNQMKASLNTTLEKVDFLENQLKAKADECDSLRSQNSRLELDLVEANMRNTHNQVETSEVNKMKEQSEEILTKAKSIIFEKTKICKNQEIQIEALNAQVDALKDVVSITKNLLEIRNVEVKHLEDQIQCMNEKIKIEKERQDLVHTKLEKMIRMNTDLKREYETQLCLFSALRERYSERELAKGVLAELRPVNREQAEADVSDSSAPTSDTSSKEDNLKSD